MLVPDPSFDKPQVRAILSSYALLLKKKRGGIIICESASPRA